MFGSSKAAPVTASTFAVLRSEGQPQAVRGRIGYAVRILEVFAEQIVIAEVVRELKEWLDLADLWKRGVAVRRLQNLVERISTFLGQFVVDTDAEIRKALRMLEQAVEDLANIKDGGEIIPNLMATPK
jgi:hypothetical protein